MFTGIVEEIGTVKSLKKGQKSAEIIVQCNVICEDLKLGDSVATNGVCLTVTSLDSTYFSADIMFETLKKTNLGELRIGSTVNLERAMGIDSRFGGHIVSGHIDGVGKIVSIKKEEIAFVYTVRTQENLLRYVIEKGSIAIDGISLTVVSVDKFTFTVSIIPHTAKETILSQKKEGDTVNLEMDVVGKYVEKLISSPVEISKEKLELYGF